ncbi:unnamed protein product [Didymodactylos carnosus]|uniref:J domain-containing protein n=1 Tax=Didymodactylos carnosus TaxID=1234261 RepID=A0A815W9G8_9BILA|nr:unnamed protein product [Didymodactylos carnosus]CAF4402450.1 unnamed protein product [Didymodactylos carnosus]
MKCLVYKVWNGDEKDYYQLLDINPNTTQTVIRNAYLRQAREFHPDKNVGRSIDTTAIFKAIKAAYETLSNDITKMSYDENRNADRDDDNDDDDIPFTSSNTHLTLHMGRKPSDDFKDQIDEYILKYKNLTFIDNYNEKINEILKEFMYSNDTIMDIDNYIECEICHQAWLNRNNHQQQNVEPYERLFNKTMAIPSSLTLQQIIDPNIWNWHSVNITSIYSSLWNKHQQWNNIKKLFNK